MREIRPSGSEGGVAHCAIPTPIPPAVTNRMRQSDIQSANRSVTD